MGCNGFDFPLWRSSECQPEAKTPDSDNVVDRIPGWRVCYPAARYSSIDLTDGLVDGGEMEILSLGVN